MQASNANVKIDLELRFGESSLLWGSSSASDADSDADIRAVSELPSNVEVAVANTLTHRPLGAYMNLTFPNI